MLQLLKKLKLKPFKASFYMNDSISSIANNTQNKGLLYLKQTYNPIISNSQLGKKGFLLFR